MLINSKDVEKRLNSPDNLLNRLRRESPRSINAKSAMSLFVDAQRQDKPPNPFANLDLTPRTKPSEAVSIYIPAGADSDVETDLVTAEGTDTIAQQVLDNLEVKVKEESIQRAALDVLSKSIRELGKQVQNGQVARPKDLADIARKMSGIVTDIKKTDTDKDKDGKTVHLHFYTPERKQLTDFEVIDVG